MTNLAKIKSSLAKRSGTTSMVSPNQGEMNFRQAVSKVASPAHKLFHAQATKLATGGHVMSAVGDWKDGAENSILIQHPHARAIAAHLGAEHNQRFTLNFKHSPSGSDRLWHVGLHNKSIGEARNILSSHGIEHRTLLPAHGGTHAVVFDQGNKLRSTMRNLRTQHGASIHYRPGTGEFLGHDNRAQAKRIFQGVK